MIDLQESSTQKLENLSLWYRYAMYVTEMKSYMQSHSTSFTFWLENLFPIK